jgi:hypothetical protein
MPCYKILGIFSFADNLKNMNINDPVILKNEIYNIKSKNAIGIYSIDDKKLGYLPTESKDEIKSFNDSYKISKIVLNQDYPILEISRSYPKINFLVNIEYPEEKKIKYEYVLVDITPELSRAVVSLEKYLMTKKIKVKRTAITYVDNNYINIIIEVNKGFQTFQCITHNYFKNNTDKYDELYENDLIENIFYRPLLSYRLECYYENNYKSILDFTEIKSPPILSLVSTISTYIEHKPLDLSLDHVDILLFVKLYIKYIVSNNNFYILKYINQITNNNFTNCNTAIKYICPNYKLLDDIINKYKFEIGNFRYDHKYKIYAYVDYINEDTVFIIADDFKVNYLYLPYLTGKTNINIYNPKEGTILKINNINLSIY